VDIGVVEIHPWQATADDIGHPDVLVFDLDPGEGIEWAYVIETALTMRDLLHAEGFNSWPKTTGGKGLHVMVPIEPSLTQDQARDYCRGLAARIVERAPDRYTLSASNSSDASAGSPRG
jgi:bifunctional non-homologous end joining protein LigD